MTKHLGRSAMARLTPVRRQLIDRLLDQLLDLPEKQRCQRLEELADRAPRIGAWVKRLAAATGQEDPGLLDTPLHDLAEDALSSRQAGNSNFLSPGERLGRWRITELVAAGGMGEVYRAERADGTFEMQAALKLIRGQSDDLARLLEHERQTLAQLSHPGIARLLDGGISGDGRPFLVMDWIDGETLDVWCRTHQPSLAEILRVFHEACQAVAAAHRALVVHGDIKPTNLKITREGRVCLLDFGVSQLLEHSHDAQTPRALTPRFAAPEALSGQPASTAFDIYGLGALLQWLTAGHLAETASVRRESSLERNLAAIIARATARDPALRYATVDTLADDVFRLQQNRPVKARHAGLGERWLLWARRHVVAAVLGITTAMSILAGVTAVVWQARMAAVERDIAQAEAARANTLREHLTLMFREVGSLSEDTKSITARELLDRTAEVAGDWLADDASLRHQVKGVLGEIMIALGDYSAAESMLSGLAGDDTPADYPLLHSIALLDMAQVDHRKGRMQQGLEAANRGLAILEAIPGAHPARLSDALQIRGRLLRDLGQRDKALADLERARRLALRVSAKPRPLMARAESNLATTLLLNGNLNRAARHFEAAEALWLALGRGDSSDALAVSANLASVKSQLGLTDEAEQRLRDVVAVRQQKYGPSGAMAAAQLNLSRLLIMRTKYEEAERHLVRARDTFERFVGKDTPDYAAAILILAELHEARGEHEQALEHISLAQQIMSERLGPAHPYTLQARLVAVRMNGRASPDAAGRHFAELASDARSVGEPAKTILAGIACDWARHESAQGRRDDARQLANECLGLRRQLGLGGWRLTEAEALVEFLRTEDREQGDRFRPLLQRLARQTAPQHPAVRWFSNHAEA
ncbi:MAG TPA: serine/threonine-protein kinase [Wenzhouxiangella sp.]|nr:serine/threonine-protein kinase [Wenzhouxiangella sp.]